MAVNGLMTQGFEWYARKDEQHWNRLNGQLEKLSNIGVDMIWIPPAAKAGANPSVGYDVYGRLKCGTQIHIDANVY